MSERARNTLTIVAVVILVGTLAALVSTQPAEVDRVQSIGAQVKCPVCQGESIADSPAQMARDMMSLVAERVEDGATDDQIIEELLSSYSGAVLLDPPIAGNTLWLWLAPVAALVVGIGVIAWWKRHPSTEQREEAPGNGRGRLVAGGVMLISALVAIVVIAINSGQADDPAAAGIAGVSQDDLDDVSNETMEAVVAANAELPEANGMRLALAERYFQAGEYSAALDHYLVVADSTSATGAERITSLIRMGYMAYYGNGEVEAALLAFDRALDVDPDSQTALYLKAQVLWCGQNETDGAAQIFESMLSDPNLPEETREQVQRDYEASSSGAACS